MTVPDIQSNDTDDRDGREHKPNGVVAFSSKTMPANSEPTAPMPA
ncbi:hypothetical protein [Mesorhizobium sp. P5_C1]